MTKSELIERLSRKQSHLAYKDVELAVKTMLEYMTQALATGKRIEIRGFGSFSLHYRPPRVGRNPKTGEPVPLEEKHVPHFKPGKDLRERVNDSAKTVPIIQSNDDEETFEPTQNTGNPGGGVHSLNAHYGQS